MSRFSVYAYIGSDILPVFCKVNDFFVPVHYSVSIQNIIQTFLSSFLSLNPSVQFLICIFLNHFFSTFSFTLSDVRLSCNFSSFCNLTISCMSFLSIYNIFAVHFSLSPLPCFMFIRPVYFVFLSWFL